MAKVAQWSVKRPGSSKSTTTASSSSKGTTLTATNTKKSSASSSSSTSSKGYRDGVDYSRELQRTDLTSAQRSQLERERQAKIDAVYGGKEPVMTGTNQRFSSGYTSGVGYTGGSGSGSSGTKSAAYNAGTIYNDVARSAAQRGDWAAVEQALNARQAKIDAQGGNDRGTSNAQLLAQLRQQYGNTYDTLAQGARDRVSLAAGEKLPFTASDGQNGNIYKDKGYDQGVDYLGLASKYAQDGDLDAAYNALMRRGFKMAETGSAGGGTSQDQAYALIHQLYSQSPGAQQTYQNKLNANRQALQDHQTQFGMEARPALAYKQFLSSDGRYWITYDGQGRPAVANPVSSKLGASRPNYSDDEIDLLSQYYSGAGDRADLAELERQLHNLAVVRTGNGRLVDQAGNWASGQGQVPVSARDWTGLPENNRNQDTAALQALLDRVNSGELFGASTAVPQGTGQNINAGLLQGTPTLPDAAPGTDLGLGNYGGLGGYGGTDLSALLQQMYQGNLDAELAQLQANYEASMAALKAQWEETQRGYQGQKNQAAIQNDLQRQQLAEMGAYYGLNTGAAGQLALGQSEALQNSLGSIAAAEGQSQADNALLLEQLGINYRGDSASAAAQSKAQQAQALYNEYVRQIQAAEAARQAAQEQARWEQQFAYQQAQDALAQQNWQTQWDYNVQSANRESASQIAYAMLEQGKVPDAATLAAAGISQADAQSYAQMRRDAIAAQSALDWAKVNKSSSGGSRSSSSSGGSELTLSQALSAAEDGWVSDAVIRTIDSYFGNGYYDQYYGDSGAGGTQGTGTGNAGDRAVTTSPRTSFYYDPDEGLFTWNTKTYNDAGLLARDLEKANLSQQEQEILKKKAKAFEFDLEF